jgi:arylsulfatase A-like enzyme
VIHTADHGDMTGSHGGQFNKGPLMYDEVCRVPLIVRNRRSAARGVCRTPIGSLALMPTILDLAGVTPPLGLHVDSVVPYIENPDRKPLNDAAYAEYHGEEWGLYSQRMIRTSHAKYVYSPHGMDELYDLTTDRFELTNRVDDPDYSETSVALRIRLLEWMVRTNDPLALWASRLL